jgi:DNA anti-recombination protein RmuC
MEIEGLEILEEQILEIISRLAKLQDENVRLKERIGKLERTLEEKEEALERLREERTAVQSNIDRLIRKIEEYQEVLSQDLEKVK